MKSRTSQKRISRDWANFCLKTKTCSENTDDAYFSDQNKNLGNTCNGDNDDDNDDEENDGDDGDEDDNDVVDLHHNDSWTNWRENENGRG